ncbi:MAG: hypothetical protein ACFHXK_00760 [bacterium]
MLPFRKYALEYPTPALVATQALKTHLSKIEGIEDRSTETTIKITHKLPIYLHNSFNPIFIGTIQDISNTSSRLVGYFRPNLFVIVFICLFLTFPIVNLWQISHLPDERLGYSDGWKEERFEFEYIFLAGAVAFPCVGWGFGLINLNKIKRAIEGSTHATPTS